MKKFMLAVVPILFLLGIGSGEGSAAYPDKPIKSLICYEAGSATDIGGRQFYKYLEKELGQPIMVVNKPGAASALGLREIYDSKPDGYTTWKEIKVWGGLRLRKGVHHE